MRIWRPHDNASLVPEMELLMTPDLLALALMKGPNHTSRASMTHGLIRLKQMKRAPLSK
jgi:hypothetical protein